MDPISFYRNINPSVDEIVKKYYEVEQDLSRYPSYSDQLHDASVRAHQELSPYTKRVFKWCFLYHKLANSPEGKIKAIDILHVINEISMGILNFRVFVFDSRDMRQKIRQLIEVTQEHNPLANLLCHSI